ncbi:MAG: hypothetical protein IPG45_11810 [Deltaproteobacteria bacterium]|jgi:hypothetical protein|nr:hypothetical protein [Deltaproteobacteria bacterium]
MRVTSQLREVAANVAAIAQNPKSQGGRTVVGDEMAAYIAVLKADGKFTVADKKAALSTFDGVRLDRDAQIMLYQETGVLPGEPTQPPIVALYAVAINDAIRNNGDVNALRALARGTELVLDGFGGASGRARVRPMATMTASGVSPAGAAGVDNAHVAEVRAALDALKARIAELQG